VNFRIAFNQCVVGGDPKCVVCHKTCYKMEAARYDQPVHNSPCFKCKECGVQLDTGNAVFHNDIFYCKMHFHSLAGQKKHLDF
jgi:hypothetical protein